MCGEEGGHGGLAVVRRGRKRAAMVAVSSVGDVFGFSIGDVLRLGFHFQAHPRYFSLLIFFSSFCFFS